MLTKHCPPLLLLLSGARSFFPRYKYQNVKKNIDIGKYVDKSLITVRAGLKETTEQLVKKKLEGKDQLTPWEDFLEKKKERKKQKKSQRNQVRTATQSGGTHRWKQRDVPMFSIWVLHHSAQSVTHDSLNTFIKFPQAVRFHQSVLFVVLYQGEEEEELSEEDLPSDVDLSDPFFAEELAATGDQYCLIINQSITVGSRWQLCVDYHLFYYETVTLRQNLARIKWSWFRVNINSWPIKPDWSWSFEADTNTNIREEDIQISIYRQIFSDRNTFLQPSLKCVCQFNRGRMF